MSTTAPICTRDTIRVIMQNELGREGQVCLEYVNKNNDLIVNIIPNSPVLCQPTGTTSLTIIPTSSGGNFRYEWITPDKQVLTTQVIQAAVPGRYFISVRDGNVYIDTASIMVQADTPAIKLTGTSAGSSLSYCAGVSVPYTLSARRVRMHGQLPTAPSCRGVRPPARQPPCGGDQRQEQTPYAPQ